MLKVFGFVRRHPDLSHDEYRAAHVGYHNSYGRRLNNIRGYVLNVRANASIDQTLGSLAGHITRNEFADFDSLWDGWGQLMFDSLETYLSAKTPARDKAGPDGLEYDPRVAAVGGDGASLYGGSPFQFMVVEHVVVPVRRPERRVFKLAQFASQQPGIPSELFRSYVTGRYAARLVQLPGLRGLVMNFRAPVDVMSKFFEPGAEAFTPEGKREREKFFGAWDCLTELWFDRSDQFIDGRQSSGLSAHLDLLETELFASVCYREVDETVAVLPNRAPAPTFYHR